ncbi:MAG: ROK family protein, partial [Cyclobacteriaceae bacterium]
MAISIVLDIGGTSIKLALASRGQLLANDKIEVSDSSLLEPLLKVISDRVRQMMLEVNVNQAELTGIGFAFPCIIDYHQGKILSDYVKYVDAHALDLQQWAQNEWGISATLENDARAALVGEWQYGKGQGSENLVQMTFGTGIGTAVLMDGHVLRGKHYLAGNLGGHVTLDLHGDVCNCGNIGCVEAVASTWALPQILKRHNNHDTSALFKEAELSYRSVFALATQGDSLATLIRNESIKAWGLAMVNMVHSFDPEKVIVSGGLMRSSEDMWPTFQMMLDQPTWLACRGNVGVVLAMYGETAALLGMDY